MAFFFFLFKTDDFFLLPLHRRDFYINLSPLLKHCSIPNSKIQFMLSIFLYKVLSNIYSQTLTIDIRSFKFILFSDHLLSYHLLNFNSKSCVGNRTFVLRLANLHSNIHKSSTTMYDNCKKKSCSVVLVVL